MKKRTKISLITAIAGIALNLFLALTKFFVGTKTNSLCIMLDSTNGFLDTITAAVTSVAFGLVALPPTEKHPYGMGRSEYVAGFVVSVTAVVMGGLFLFNSLSRMAMPEPVWYSTRSFVLILIGIPIKGIMATVYYILSRKIHSKAFKALALDSILDVAITTATVISFSLSPKADFAVDSIFGICISIGVIVASVFMVGDNLRALVSGDCKDERKKVVEACKEDKDTSFIEKIDLHDYGYAVKVGYARVVIKKGADRKAVEERLHNEVKNSCGADVTFYAAEE